MSDKRQVAINNGVQAKAMLYDNNRKEAKQLGFLYDLAIMAPDGPAVEIGVYRGGSVITWSKAREGRGDLYAVDDWSYKNKGTRNRKLFLENMGTYGIEIMLVDGKSWEVGNQVPNDLAFVFIDGDHSYLGIPRDMYIWPYKIRVGGIIAFHDYGVPNPRVFVKQVVDAWHREYGWEFIEKVGSTIAFRRPL